MKASALLCIDSTVIRCDTFGNSAFQMTTIRLQYAGSPTYTLHISFSTRIKCMALHCLPPPPPFQARQATAATATGLGRHGRIRDAVIILQAAGRGLIPHVTCRLPMSGVMSFQCEMGSKVS